MTTEDLISVIVPVYMVEEYLQDCVDSILKQTYQNFELILVDDGTPDSSGRMCDEYAEKDSRVKVIHKDNGGLSDARNAGIEVATGKYITFIDSDDVVASNYLEIMYQLAQNYQAELVQGKLTRNLESLGEISQSHQQFDKTDDVMKNYLLFKDLQGYACNKLYAMRLFKDLGLRYPVGMIQEDAWVTYKALYEAKGVVLTDSFTYFYRVNPESIMNGKFNPKRFDILKVPDTIKAFLSEKNPSGDYQKYLDYFTMRTALKTYNDCIQKGAEKANEENFAATRKMINGLKPDGQLWEKKYVVLTRMIKYCPRVYRFVIKRFR